MSAFRPNPSQSEVLACRDRLCVLAGAGSGKTGTLVESLVQRLSETAANLDPAERLDITDILALTFTEKAAAELRQRLARAFADRTRAAETPAEAEFWRRQAARLDRADIGTIHGYASKLVRENAPALGLTTVPDLEDDDRALSRDLRHLFLDWLDAGDPDLLGLLERYRPAALLEMLEKCATRLGSWGLRELTAELRPVEADFPALLNDFKTLAAEGLDLVRHGDLNRSKPYYQKVLTAMEELTRRLAPPAEELAADLDANLAVFSSLVEGGGAWYSRLGKPMRLRLLAALGEIRARRCDQLAGPLKEKLLRLVNRLPGALAERKHRRGVIDFDDLLILSRRLLATRPEVRRREIRRRRLVVVDEFQDTNRLQADLLAYLLLPPEDTTVYPEDHPLWRDMDWAAASDRFSVFGDLKQSIYRFRGAEVDIMAGLRAAFDGGGGRVLALDHNYRSQGPLITFFNTLFPEHLGEGFDSRDLQAAARPALYEAPQVVVLRGTGERGPGGEARARRQAGLLVRYLDDLFQGRRGVLVDDGTGRGRSPVPGDVAVLFRRFTWAGVFREALTEAGWKCRLAVGESPFDYAEVRGLLAALRFLSGLDRDLSLAALLRSPLGPVSDAALMTLAWPEARRHSVRLGDYFGPAPRPWPEELDPEDRKTLDELRGLLAALTPLVGRAPTVEILERLVEERRLLPLAVLEEDGDHRVRAVTGFLALSRRVDRRRPHQPLGPAEELLEMAREWNPRRQGGEPPADDHALTLMTVHGAKGLEFPVVVLAEADNRPRFMPDPVAVSGDGRLALRFKDAAGGIARPSDFTAAEEEERALDARENGRLFYVAVTRARDHLVFLGDPDPKKEAARAKESKADDVEKNPETVWLEALLDHPGAMALTGMAEYDPDGPLEGRAPAGAAAEDREPPAPPALLNPMTLTGRTLAVTALGRFLADPEAFYREHHLGLPRDFHWRPGEDFFRLEPPKGSAVRKPTGRLTPPEAGTLFHAILETISPLAPETEAILRREAARLGLNPAPAEAAALTTAIETFLAGPLGRAWREALAAGRPDHREREFRLVLAWPPDVPEPVAAPGADGRLPGAPTLTLTGVIDLFFLTESGGQIVDYKLAALHPGPELEAYEHQVRVYAQALVAAGFQGEIRAALYFAGGAAPVIHSVNLDQSLPIRPLLSQLKKNFFQLRNTRPLRPSRPGALNIV